MMVTFVVTTQTKLAMGKNTNFSGQPILNQLIMFLDRGKIRKITKQNDSDRYVKKFSTYNHVVVMLFVAFEGYHSLREVVLGLLANANKLSHLGFSYIVRRSTFSEANQRRSSKVFGEIYMDVYHRHVSSLADSRLSDADMKRLYIMDSTTISLFKDILQGVGRNPKEGKKKGGIKAHTIIKADENVSYLIRYSEAVRHDHTFLKEVHHLPKGSIITFDKGYVDYAQYEKFTSCSIWYVTRLKDNTLYQARLEYEIPEDADSGVLKDEEIVLFYGEKKKDEHKARRIAYWDSENSRLFEFITNNFELTAEKIALIYKRRWQIELLFKQLKQNFPLKYFLGDNENAIEIQIWSALLANLLITLIKSKINRKWAFSNMVSVIRQQLMNYINIFSFLEDPEGCWRTLILETTMKKQSLFLHKEGAYF
jgi:hypothetical protein